MHVCVRACRCVRRNCTCEKERSFIDAVAGRALKRAFAYAVEEFIS